MLLSRKMSELQARKVRGEKGFSLIEMLVVVIIIGVIAAIAVPLFLNQQEKAEDANKKATIATIAKTLATGQGTGGSASVADGILSVTDGAGGVTTAPLNGASVTGSSDLSAGTWCVTLDGFTIAAGEAQPREAESCVPGGASGLSTTPGSGEITLSWSTPQANGSQPVTGYKVEYAIGNEGPWTVAVANTASTSYTVTGLTNGTQYWFKVTALNAFGEGAAVTTASTPITTPGAPTGLTATPGSVQLELSWSAPGSNGGSAITGYTVEYATNSAGPWTTHSTTAATTRTITGLTVDVQYWVRVSANNAAGEGTAATTTGVPLAPPSIFAVEYLVIAGGGSGGRHRGEGGSAGGYRSNVSGESSGGGSSAEPALSISVGEAYTVTVGAGGVNGNGTDSVFENIVSIGGVAGAQRPIWAVASGGGGAGQTAQGGNGGDGLSSSITGTSIIRGGGGGGGAGCMYQWMGPLTLGGTGGAGGGGAGGNSSHNYGVGAHGYGVNGTANTGGGGGGGAGCNAFNPGGSGGSGVVVLKYPSFYQATFSAGVTQSTSTIGGFKVTQITATATTSETVTFS